jgi:spermidine synthase
MRLPFTKSSVRRSKHNGLLVVNELGEVFAYGTKQTSMRYGLMWGDALARANLNADVQSVLMLGLAGGGALAPIHQLYPAAKVVAVEYDPTMVEVAHELLLDAPFPFPQVIIADAEEALQKITERYELILVDIFVGSKPSPLISSGAFWAAVRARLAPGGCVVLNVAGDYAKTLEAQKHFARSASWQYSANTFCALY